MTLNLIVVGVLFLVSAVLGGLTGWTIGRRMRTDYQRAQAEMEAAIDNVKLEIGAALLPALTKLAKSEAIAAITRMQYQKNRDGEAQ